MITPSNTYKIYLATEPVDFRKGMDGLASLVSRNFDLDPFSGAFFIFRSKGRERMKILLWDGTGLILVYKRIEGTGLIWPKIADGILQLTKAQFEALFEGIDWRQVIKPRYRQIRLA